MEWHAKINRDLGRLGLRPAELARRLGVSQTTVDRWVNKGSKPYNDVLLPLAKLLGVPVEYLLDDAQDEPPAAPEADPALSVVLGLVRVLGVEEATRRLAMASVHAPNGTGHGDAPRPLNRPTYGDQVRAGLIPDHPPEALPPEHREPAAPASKPKRKAR